MTFTYVLSTSVGQVRALIPDRVTADAFFTDEEITAFLLLEADNIRRTTAMALETMASSEAYVQKVIKLLDLTTDGAKTSDALVKRAGLLRAQADVVEAGEAGGSFDFAEWVVNDFALREEVVNDALRDL